jgi:hypothetical protein
MMRTKSVKTLRKHRLRCRLKERGRLPLGSDPSHVRPSRQRDVGRGLTHLSGDGLERGADLRARAAAMMPTAIRAASGVPIAVAPDRPSQSVQ